MRSRAVREGSVGLLILAGFGLLAAVTIWLRDIEFGRKTYNLVVEFANANGLSVGTPVRYRGVDVGKIVSLNPGANGVEVTLEIDSTDLLIPKNATIKANQSGLLNQSSIDITPLQPLPQEALDLSPIAKNCQGSAIVCNNERLQGQAGATLDDLLTSTVRLSEVYASPEFAKNLNKLLATAEVTAVDVSKLSKELNILSRSVRGQIPTLSTNAARTSAALNTTALSLSQTATRLSQTVDTTANRISQSVDTTAGNFNQLSTNLNRLVRANEANLGNTLESLTTTSSSLQDLLVSLRPAVRGLNAALQPEEVEQLVQNLDTLIANATKASENIDALLANTTAASANLRDLSASFNDPNLVLSLQQTLNSARETFDNARKITSDLDELTGDPTFRSNLRNLVNGLSNLVSSTQHLEQQMQLAEALEQSRQTMQALENQVQVAREWQQLQLEKQHSHTEASKPSPAQKQPKHLTNSAVPQEPTVLPIQSSTQPHNER